MVSLQAVVFVFINIERDGKHFATNKKQKVNKKETTILLSSSSAVWMKTFSAGAGVKLYGVFSGFWLILKSHL